MSFSYHLIFIFMLKNGNFFILSLYPSAVRIFLIERNVNII